MSYLKQAIETSASGDSEQAIALLKLAIAQTPPDAAAVFMLAAEYAALERYEEAVIVYRQAIALEPRQGVAHFQLGLLLLTLQRPEEALASWKGLDPWPEDHYLQLMRQGMEALCADRFEECIEMLSRGIAANAEVVPLNSDMRLVIERVQNLLRGDQGNGPPPEAKATVEPTDYLLSIYHQGSSNPTRH